jgi:hypothetical protein
MAKYTINYYNIPIILIFLIAFIFYYSEFYNITIIFILVNNLFIYKYCKTKFRSSVIWLSHPLRLMIPLTLGLQSLLWIIFLLSSNSITFFNYEWTPDYHFDPSNIPHAFSSFLLLISVYFYSLAITYNPKKLYDEEVNKMSLNLLLYVTLFLLIVISLFEYIFIYASLVRIEVNPILNYIFKFLATLRPLFTMVLLYYLWFKNATLSKIYFVLFLVIYLTIGFWGVFVTSMRQIIFEPIIITLIFFYTIRDSIHLNLYKIILISVILIFVFQIFYIASSIKFKDTSSSFDQNQPTVHKFLSSFEKFVSRGTIYYSDLIALSNPDSERLFKSNSENVFTEIVSGVPFGSLLIPDRFKSRYSFNMQFFWSYLPEGISSTYVSGTSSLWFIFGLPLALLFIFLIGAFHGSLFQFIANFTGVKYTWLILYSMTSLFFFYGLTRSDLLGLPVYSLIGALIFKYFFIKKTPQHATA